MRRLRDLLLPLGAALLAAAALSACGGGSATSSRANGTTSAPTAPAGTQTLTSGVGSTPTQTGGSQTVTLTQTTTSTTPAPTAAGAPARCTARDLGIHFVRGLGAAGTSYLTFAFVNVTQQACTLQGYPGVSLVLTSGAVDDVTNNRTPRSVRRVVVNPGGRAPFVVGVPGNAAPHCVHAADFRFIPPNDTAYEQIHQPMEVCGDHVSVTPVGQTQ